jgi:integrase
MRGHLFQDPTRPGDQWSLVVELPPDPVTGKRRRQVRSFRGTKRAADKALTALVAEADRGRQTGTSTTVDDLLARWLSLAELEVSTRRRYRGLIRLHISPALGSTPLRRLEPSELDELYRGLLKRGLAPATVRQVHAVLRRALAQAVKWGWLPTNTAAMATPPQARRSTLTPPTPDEAVRLVKAGRSWGDGTLGSMLHVAATTGARRGELCGLRWGDLDAEAGELVIERSVTTAEDGHSLLIKSTKTRSSRTIALDEGTIAVMNDHRVTMEKRAGDADLRLVPGAYVWSDDLDGSRPWRPDRVTQAFRKLCARQGVTGVRLHDLRHFAATQLMAEGTDAVTVAGRLGHHNPSMTFDVYSHRVTAADRRAADVLGSMLA